MPSVLVKNDYLEVPEFISASLKATTMLQPALCQITFGKQTREQEYGPVIYNVANPRPANMQMHIAGHDKMHSDSD